MSVTSLTGRVDNTGVLVVRGFTNCAFKPAAGLDGGPQTDVSAGQRAADGSSNIPLVCNAAFAVRVRSNTGPFLRDTTTSLTVRSSQQERFTGGPLVVYNARTDKLVVAR